MKEHIQKNGRMTPRIGKLAFTLLCAGFYLLGHSIAIAETYTITTTGTYYWQDEIWSPDAGPNGPGAGDTIGNVMTGMGTAKTTRMDAEFSTAFSIANFIRSGAAGHWYFEAWDNGRTNEFDPVRNVSLSISGNLEGNNNGPTHFRSNTSDPDTMVTLSLTVGGTVTANTGDLYLGAAQTATNPGNYSQLSSLSISGQTTINENRLLALWVEPGQANLARLHVIGTAEIYRVTSSVPVTNAGSVNVASLTGTGTLKVSSIGAVGTAEAPLAAALNIVGPGNGNYAGILENGATITNKRLNVVKSGNGAQIFSGNNNVYSGGTVISGGQLLAQNSSGSALGSGEISVLSGGTLGGNGFIVPSNGNNVSIAGRLRPGYYDYAGSGGFNTNIVSFLPGILTFNLGGSSRMQFEPLSTLELILGEESSMISFQSAGDWLEGSGNLTLNLILDEGFDYGQSYTVFQNVTTENFSISGVTGFDSINYAWMFGQEDADYVLSFEAIPEPSIAGLFVVASLVFYMLRCRKKAMRL